MMFTEIIRNLVDRPNRFTARRPRLKIKPEGPIYAIGDVHGCLGALQEIEDAIRTDAAGANATVIMLGDYVDRGPSSADVLDHLLCPARGFRRLCIAGNHEAMMLAFLGKPSAAASWLRLGGAETLASYGIPLDLLRRPGVRAMLNSHVPEEHVAFIEQLPVAVSAGDWIFVHAGVQPGRPFEAQDDEDLMTRRDGPEADYGALGRTIVHGHTLVARPLLTGSRIAIDTGAYLTGRLTAVRLEPGAAPRFLSVRVAPD